MGNWHNGVDYGMPEGTPLIAPGSGLVRWAGWDDTGFGIKVVIDHGNGWKSLLGHTRNVVAGQSETVTQGQVVALAGSTGAARGAHVHWSVIQESTYHFFPPALFVFPQTVPPPKTLSFRDVRWYAWKAGFAGRAKDTMAAIAYAESRFDPHAQLVNTDGSLDRGIVQINNRWHPEVSDQCAYTPLCAMEAAYRISKGGTDFTPWTTYNVGAYLPYVNAPDTMT